MADELTSVISYTAPRPARSPAYLHTTCIRHVGGSAPLPVVRTRATPGIVGAERLERAAPLPGNSGVARALHRPAEHAQLAGRLIDREADDAVVPAVRAVDELPARVDDDLGGRAGAGERLR